MEDVPAFVADNNGTENGYHGPNGRFARGNPGKPPGSSKNKLRDQVKGFLSENWDRFPEFFEDLTPKEKVQTMIDLLPYAVPRLKHTDVSFEPSAGEEEILRQEIAAGFNRLFEIPKDEDRNSKGTA